MKIVSFKICPFVQRVTALLEAKNLDYDLEFISLNNKPQWFLELSPNGQVPVLITDGGVALFESDAIVEYIEEAYSALTPGLAPEQKALDRAWSYLGTKHYLPQCSAQRSVDAATLRERAAKLDQAFDRVEAQLRASRYFGGDSIGMVDIAWLPLLHRAQIIEVHTRHDFIGARPRLKSWQQSLLSDDLAQRSVAPDFEEAFVAFYLTPETHLGRMTAPGTCCPAAARVHDPCC